MEILSCLKCPHLLLFHSWARIGFFLFFCGSFILNLRIHGCGSGHQSYIYRDHVTIKHMNTNANRKTNKKEIETISTILFSFSSIPFVSFGFHCNALHHQHGRFTPCAVLTPLDLCAWFSSFWRWCAYDVPFAHTHPEPVVFFFFFKRQIHEIEWENR